MLRYTEQTFKDPETGLTKTVKVPVPVEFTKSQILKPEPIKLLPTRKPCKVVTITKIEQLGIPFVFGSRKVVVTCPECNERHETKMEFDFENTRVITKLNFCSYCGAEFIYDCKGE